MGVRAGPRGPTLTLSEMNIVVIRCSEGRGCPCAYDRIHVELARWGAGRAEAALPTEHARPGPDVGDRGNALSHRLPGPAPPSVAAGRQRGAHGVAGRGVGGGALAQARAQRRIVVPCTTTLARRDDLPELIAAYGFIVVDECHHIPAAAFENAVRQVRGRRWLGPTATRTGATSWTI
jgi:hypothetical protein